MPRGRVDLRSPRLGEHGLYWATPSPGRCGRPRLLARLGPGADLGFLRRWGIGPSPDGGFRQSNRRRPAGQACGTAWPEMSLISNGCGSTVPNRLRICALLVAVSSAEFSTVREALGVADGVLSKHVAVLHAPWLRGGAQVDLRLPGQDQPVAYPRRPGRRPGPHSYITGHQLEPLACPGRGRGVRQATMVKTS